MSESHRASACPCCHSSPAKLLSAKQANSRLRQPRATLATTQRRCEDLRLQLLQSLEHQESLRALFQKAHAAEEELRQQSLRSTKAIDNISSTRSKLKAAQARVQGLQAKLRDLPQQVTKLKQTQEAVLRELSNRRKAHELAAQSLAARQAMEINALQHVLPVRISGVKANTRQPMQVSIYHMRLPEVASKAPAQMQADARGSSAALGYLTLQIQLFASVLDAPVLHEGHYLGLHSSVWQARSFWHTKADQAQVLLLSGLPTDALSSSFMSSGPASWASTLDTPDQSRQEASLCQAVRMLMRSSACVCQHYMARQGRALPMYWSPFAWLVLVTECAQGRRRRTKGSAWELASVAPTDDGSTHAVDVHECFTDHEQDDSEWNLVQTPGEVLPPPPSEEVDTEHWERVMFRDRQERVERPAIPIRFLGLRR